MGRAACVLGVLVACVACGRVKGLSDTEADADRGATGGSPDSIASAGAGGAPLGAGTGGGTPSFGAGGVQDRPSEPESCPGVGYASQPFPRALFILFDRSAGMSTLAPDGRTWFEVAREGLEDFLALPYVRDIEVALATFPGDDGASLADAGSSSCGEDASFPLVDFAPAAENAPRLLDALAERSPMGDRALGPALAQALEFTDRETATTPFRSVMVVTSGRPDACEPDTPSELASLLAGYGTSVPVSIVALDEDALPDDPFLEVFDGGADVPFPSVETMSLGLRGGAYLTGLCEYALPEDMTDPDQIGVVFHGLDGLSSSVVHLFDESSCDLNQGQGWYYYETEDPRRLFLCPETCAQTWRGEITIEYGCAQVLTP